MAWHALMPDVNDNKNVFYTHALQKREELLSTAFFITIIVSLCHIGRLFTISYLIFITLAIVCVAIGS